MPSNRSEIMVDVAEILVEILDVEPEDVFPEAYLMRDLEVESIDLMELAVNLNERFGLDVNEEVIFLKSLRSVLEKARETGADAAAAVAGEFPFLTARRIAEMVVDLDGGPVLKVKDLVDYVNYYGNSGSAHAH